jgi:hypothetical protein
MRLLTAIVECPYCQAESEGTWPDPSLDEQDRAEAPVSLQTCPACGWRWYLEYPGWSFQSEAG